MTEDDSSDPYYVVDVYTIGLTSLILYTPGSPKASLKTAKSIPSEERVCVCLSINLSACSRVDRHADRRWG